MKMMDSVPGHRAIQLDNNEVLDSEFATLSLAANAGYSIEDAYKIVSELFTAIEEALEPRKQAASFTASVQS
jgi:hypothetical protein